MGIFDNYTPPSLTETKTADLANKTLAKQNVIGTVTTTPNAFYDADTIVGQDTSLYGPKGAIRLSDGTNTVIDAPEAPSTIKWKHKRNATPEEIAAYNASLIAKDNYISNVVANPEASADLRASPLTPENQALYNNNIGAATNGQELTITGNSLARDPHNRQLANIYNNPNATGEALTDRLLSTGNASTYQLNNATANYIDTELKAIEAKLAKGAKRRSNGSYDNDGRLGNLVDAAQSRGVNVLAKFGDVAVDTASNALQLAGVKPEEVSKWSALLSAKDFNERGGFIGFDNYKDTTYTDKVFGYDNSRVTEATDDITNAFTNGNITDKLLAVGTAIGVAPEVIAESLPEMAALFNPVTIAGLLAAKSNDTMEAIRKNNDGKDLSASQKAQAIAGNALVIALDRFGASEMLGKTKVTSKLIDSLVGADKRTAKALARKVGTSLLKTGGVGIAEGGTEILQTITEQYSEKYGTKAASELWDSDMQRELIASGYLGFGAGSALKGSVEGVKVAKDTKDTVADAIDKRATKKAIAKLGGDEVTTRQFIAEAADEKSSAISKDLKNTQAKVNAIKTSADLRDAQNSTKTQEVSDILKAAVDLASAATLEDEITSDTVKKGRDNHITSIINEYTDTTNNDSLINNEEYYDNVLNNKSEYSKEDTTKAAIEAAKIKKIKKDFNIDSLKDLKSAAAKLSLKDKVRIFKDDLIARRKVVPSQSSIAGVKKAVNNAVDKFTSLEAKNRDKLSNITTAEVPGSIYSTATIDTTKLNNDIPTNSTIKGLFNKTAKKAINELNTYSDTALEQALSKDYVHDRAKKAIKRVLDARQAARERLTRKGDVDIDKTISILKKGGPSTKPELATIVSTAVGSNKIGSNLITDVINEVKSFKKGYEEAGNTKEAATYDAMLKTLQIKKRKTILAEDKKARRDAKKADNSTKSKNNKNSANASGKPGNSNNNTSNASKTNPTPSPKTTKVEEGLATTETPTDRDLAINNTSSTELSPGESIITEDLTKDEAVELANELNIDICTKG